MQKKLFMILFGLVLLIPIQFVQADQDYGPPPPESKPVFQAAQHVAGPSDPWENGAIDTPSKIDSFNWQTKPWTFERGDHIVGVIVPVGGFEFEWGIYNEAQFRRALSYADDRIVVKIIDRNTGRICCCSPGINWRKTRSPALPMWWWITAAPTRTAPPGAIWTSA